MLGLKRFVCYLTGHDYEPDFPSWGADNVLNERLETQVYICRRCKLVRVHIGRFRMPEYEFLGSSEFLMSIEKARYYGWLVRLDSPWARSRGLD